jgi:sugar O-acyltransferase (sialic acid O-acetyltransferase NeuD family)
MKKVVIYGNTITSKMLFHDADGDNDFVIEAFAVDSEYLTNNTFMGLPQVDFSIVEKVYPPSEYDMLAVLSGFENMRSRNAFFLKSKEKGYMLRNYVSQNCDFNANVTMGINNIIFAQSHVGTDGCMGDNNIIRQNVYLGHDFKLGNNNTLAPGCNIAGRCQIRNSCYVGIGATIVEDVRLNDETLVGAGSVVIKNTEPHSKNVGNPSRIIGYHKENGIMMRRINR